VSIVPGIVQVLGFEPEESAHSLEVALVRKALSLKGAEQLSCVDYEYASVWDQLRKNSGEPVYRRLDCF
jgi:hypothetical protein